MQPQSRRRQNSRLIAWMLVLALIPVAVATAALHTAYRRASAALVIERDRQLASLSAARLADELLSYSGALTALARTPELYRQNVAEQQAALDRASRRLAAFDAGVVLLDSLGTIRASMPERPEILLQDWSDHRFFQELLTSSELAFSDAVNDGPDGTPVAILGARILNEEGQFVGALAGMFGLGRSAVSSFYASIVRLRLGQSGSTYIIDGNGRILYDSGYSQVGTILDTHSLPPGVLQGIAGASRARDLEGHQVVAAFAPVPRTGWTLLIEDDWNTVTRGTQRYSNLLLALVAAGVALPAGGVALLVRQRHAEAHDEEEMEQARQVAGLVHQSLLPRHPPLLPGWDLAVRYLPAGTAGGDFYDTLLLPDGRLMLAICSTADRSVRAALVTATTRAALRGAAYQSLDPAAALAHGNQLLSPEVQADSPVTCLYSILDPAAGRLQLASAGRTLSYHGGNGEVRQLDGSGEPLGLDLTTGYKQSEVALRPGEWLLFVSDGLVSARNALGEAFGATRLRAVLGTEASSGQTLLGAVWAALESFGGGTRPEHDITALLLQRSGGESLHD